ncbi:MAG: crotonase/enoyl-CoA hydratase family protein [Rhodospirillaceae bacterium]|jgi:enoyl-CoA hydratase/carnithine racemase|nr:crotonase/enoyl-CoA hydratase family protein [Rhodospirillaceae bacterium]MBT6140225.1 crotonase/enoyl-CoA hydratase family protein [Rhodospirillaceae bacterium]
MPLLVSEPARHVVLVTIDNQAKRNAMSREMLGELADLWDRLGASPACRCIVVTGAGDKGFCAGADIGGDLSAAEETAHTVNRALLKNTPFAKPIIAAVNGDCAGGGIELLLSTDIRIAAEHARFGLPEVKWSIYPFGGATVKLTQQIGYVHAMDLILTGRLVDAAFAREINLINRVCPAADVLGQAVETASAIAANSPSAVQAVKAQISEGIADYTLSREARDQALGDQVRASAYFDEGVAAFREKRQPDYS